MSQYTWVIVETYAARGERSPREIRARPVPGQGLDTKMNVECSGAMRNRYPAGTYIRLKAKVTDREGGPPFLYSYHGWPYEVLTKDQVEKLIRGRT